MTTPVTWSADLVRMVLQLGISDVTDSESAIKYLNQVKTDMTATASETVTISRAEYERLQERDDWLSWLEAAGVDNWDGMDEAINMRQEFRDGAGD